MLNSPPRRITRPPAAPATGGVLAGQAAVVRALGSEFVARLLEAGERQAACGPLTHLLLRRWPGDPAAAALAMRFYAGLHALARRGEPVALARLFADRAGDVDAAVGAALAAHDGFIAAGLCTPTQTNEVARAGAIVAALMVAARRFARPFELLELGASAGLNLNLAQYAYDLGGRRAGDRASPVVIAPGWRGPPPPAARVRIAAARGVDLNPLDPGDAATAERLLSYVWVDQPDRVARLGHALAIARARPPRIDRAGAAGWLAERLAGPQPAGTCRVVVHSMVRQYICPADRAAIDASLAAAGRRATHAAPLAHVSFEWTAARDEVRLDLTTWPGDGPRTLAACHPYGAWIDWRG